MASSPFFIAIPDAVLTRKGLTFADKVVYGAILAYQGKRKYCYASYEKIARRIDGNVSTVKRAVAKLRKSKLPGPGAVPLIIPTLVDNEKGGEVQFEGKGGYLGGRTRAWTCTVLLPQEEPRLVSMPKSRKTA